ncbi:Serine/threonine-protein phosphatase 2A regulatory subunit B'' subunit gamma [Folsomia candida]|uniref:Serine/threonine-protein phosphatase 2A regulatory subunit B'' subunit gamma n=1 Tax=Folsomia candida TaxID=158441 RepID=A0A226F6E1_FOLCA|nr:Serine/threonine-protein phosphatase 2A regulatory subunit B'' subunit gamma [Folsomia candida]
MGHNYKTPIDDLWAVVQERNVRMEKLVRKAVEDMKSMDGESKTMFKNTSPIVSIDDELAKVAHQRVCERMTSELFDNSELETLWRVLVSNSNRGPRNIPLTWWRSRVEGPLRENGDLQDQLHMDFVHYLKSKKELGPRYEQLLTGKLFFTLKMASEPIAKKINRIRTSLVFRYICDRNYNKFLQLTLYQQSSFGTGFLTEQGLINFLLEYEPFQVQYSRTAFPNEYYVILAIKRFFFFLDPQRTGKLRIVDIMASGLIDEIRVVEENQVSEFSLDLRRHSCDDPSNHHQTQIQLTPTFVEKLFSSVATLNNQMDFKTFTEFVLANTYIDQPQSLAYFMRIMNRSDKGYLDEFDLHYYYKDIKMRYNGDPVEFDDVKLEIFDIVNPTFPDRITTKDLIKCLDIVYSPSGKGPAIIRMLLSAKGFENFETLDLGSTGIVV